MNKLFTILGFIGAILGLIFSFLPISNLAIFPAVIGLIFGLIAYTSARKQNGKSSFQRIVVLLSLIAIIISVGKQLVFTDTVKEDVQFIEKTEQSKQDAVKELEELEEELNEDLDELE
jgi:uncharacterized membrane protein HdeD (DUF308 family)